MSGGNGGKRKDTLTKRSANLIIRGSNRMEIIIKGTAKEIYEFLVGNQKPSQTESFLYALKFIEKERAGESGIPIKFRRED